MARIRVHDREFPMVENFTFAEIDYAEKLVKEPLDQWSSSQTIRCTILLSVRRVDVGFLTWNALGGMTLDDITFVEEEDDAAKQADLEAQAGDPTEEAEDASGSEASSEQRETST